MTTVRLLLCPAKTAARVVGNVLGALLITLLTVDAACPQGPAVHWHHSGAMPPGAIGSQRLRRGGPLSGYFQPVQIRCPRGVLAALAEGGGFASARQTPQNVGLLVAAVYRLRVTNIPNHPGEEVYPTIELIDRLYPPPGQSNRFPIPIELTAEELQMALEGKFVTRVIYLEDPERALPVAQGDLPQNWIEAHRGEDPLEVADRLGRPVAILRIGGRVPTPGIADPGFLYGSPPFVTLTHPSAAAP